MADELLRLRALTRNLPLFSGVKRFQIATPRQEKVWIRDLPELLAKIHRIKADGKPNDNNVQASISSM
jgi:hypothetical protein